MGLAVVLVVYGRDFVVFIVFCGKNGEKMCKKARKCVKMCDF